MSFRVHADIAEDGSAVVTEVITWDFAEVESAGIRRYLPAEVSPNDPITAHSDDAPDDLLVTSESTGTQIQIGDPEIGVTGQHTYTIEYPLHDLVDGDWVHWNALGSGWQVPIDSVHVEMVAPFALTDIDCFYAPPAPGRSCDVTETDAGQVAVTAEDVDVRQGLRLEATVVRSTPEPGGGLGGALWVLPAALCVVGLTFAAIWRTRHARRLDVGAPPIDDT